MKKDERLTQGRPKVLFTTPLLEHPPAGGPALRIENSIKALDRVSELHVASRLGREAIGGPNAEAFYCRHSHVFAYTPNDTRADNAADERQNAEALVNYAHSEGIGIIWCGYGNISYHLMKAIKQLDPRLKVVCDTDSVWSRFILRELEVEMNAARRAQIEREGREKEREESEFVALCDVTTAVSKVDAEYYRTLASDDARVQIFSNVIDLDSYREPPRRSPEIRSPNMYLAGSFYSETSPMANAARWVIAEVLPIVRRSLPEIQLVCVGSGADRILADIHDPNILIKGKVPSVLPYLCHADVSIVPLKFESGTRFKIMEAAACGIPIVSTTLGAEGIPVEDGRDVLLADDPDAFASAVVRVITDAECSRRLRHHCRLLIERLFSLGSLEREAETIIRSLSVTNL